MADRPFAEPDDFRELLREARAGSAEALGRLWMGYRDYLLLIARQRLSPALQGKVSPSDLVQETFLEAQRDLVGFHDDGESALRAWLCGILIHNVSNAARRFLGTEKRDVSREVSLSAVGLDSDAINDVPRDTPTPSSRVIANEEVDALERALAELPANYRNVLRLRYHDGLTFAQIGAAQSCSAEAARKLWARAVQRLEKHLDRNS